MASDLDRDDLATAHPPLVREFIPQTSSADVSARRGRAVAAMLADYTKRHADVRCIYVAHSVADSMRAWHASFLRTDGTLPPVRGVPVIVASSMGGADVTIVHRDGRAVDVHDAPRH